MSEAENNSVDENMALSNEEIAKQWAIDVDQDPYSIPMPELNPAHPLLHEANRALPYF